MHYALHINDFKTGILSTIQSMLNNDPQLLNFSRAHSNEAVRLIVHIINSVFDDRCW